MNSGGQERLGYFIFILLVVVVGGAFLSAIGAR